MEMKYFTPNKQYHDLLFKSNGASLAIYMATVSTLISGGKLDKSIFLFVPCILFVLGLLFAYDVYMKSLLLDEDIKQRERLNFGLEWIEGKRKIMGETPEFAEIERQHKIIDADARKLLLTVDATKEVNSKIGRQYLNSMRCFGLGVMFSVAEFGWYLLS